MTERIRLTITVTPEVHETFSRMAEAAGLSLGRCMGDWLADTLDGAQFVAQKMVEAKKMPRTVMREFQAMAAGLHDVITEDMERMRDGATVSAARRGGAHPLDGKASEATAALIARSRRQAPPSSNTGGKSPGKTRKPAAGKGAPR